MMISERQLGYREFQVVKYVHETIAVEGIAPSYRMIKEALGITTKGEVCRIVGKLEKRGILRRAGRGRVRRIRLPL
jgi:SOS-response transcriptional repressor LexA